MKSVAAVTLAEDFSGCGSVLGGKRVGQRSQLWSVNVAENNGTNTSAIYYSSDPINSMASVRYSTVLETV
jgi:hypothetical protein